MFTSKRYFARSSVNRCLVAVLLGMGLLGATAAISAENVLRYVEGADIDTLDPAVSRSRPSQIITTHVFDTLVQWKDTTLSAIVPDLAESWQISADKRKWTFKLRRGITFQDGTPFNAAAVKFNVERVLDPQLGSPNRSLYVGITNVSVVDDFTVVIETKEPMPTLLEALAIENSGISSPAAVEKFGRRYGRNPVGTGPYMVKEWTPGERCVLVRNPRYTGPKPKPDTIVYRPVPEGGARVVELQSGNADIVTGIPPEAVEGLKKTSGIRVEIVPSSFQLFFELNNTRPPFNDVRVRRAVNLAIDRKAIIEKILGGYGHNPDGLFPPGVQGRVQLKPYAYDPEEAKRLIHEVYPDGYKDTVVMWSTEGRYMKDRSVAEAVQGYLNKIGFKTEFRVWEWATYQRTLYKQEPGKGTGKGSNEANMWFLGTSIPTADWRLRRKVSTGDASNLTGYSDPAVDELLAKAAVNMDYKQRMAQLGEIQRIFWEKNPGWLFLFNQVQIIGVRDKVKGLEMFAYELPVLNNVTTN